METDMKNIIRADLEALAMQTCDAVTGEPAFPHELQDLDSNQLLTLVTVAQFVTDLCINELERRNMLEACEDCGGPQVPYISDHGVLTIFTRDNDEGQPAGAGQPTAH
jgi:hypothetical protein